MVMNCFPAYDNLVIPYLKSIFGGAKSVVIFQDMRLAWVHKPTANRVGHSEIFSSCGQIWIENRSYPAPDRRKTQGNLRFTTQIKHWGGWWSFWKPIVGRHFDGKNWFSEADSPLEIQINFAYRLSNSFSKTNYPEWNSSEQLAEDAPRALQLSHSLRAKRQSSSDFEERNTK